MISMNILRHDVIQCGEHPSLTYLRMLLLLRTSLTTRQPNAGSIMVFIYQMMISINIRRLNVNQCGELPGLTYLRIHFYK